MLVRSQGGGLVPLSRGQQRLLEGCGRSGCGQEGTTTLFDHIRYIRKARGSRPGDAGEENTTGREELGRN